MQLIAELELFSKIDSRRHSRLSPYLTKFTFNDTNVHTDTSTYNDTDNYTEMAIDTIYRFNNFCGIISALYL